MVILQHPRERQHPLGTERFARLGLHDCSVHIAWGVALPPNVVPAQAALLYPSDQAREITDIAPEERPRTLVAIDGTWSQARSLYRKNPWLAELPHVKLTKAPPSNYRIRREPRAEYVSTIEALVHALRCLEPDTEGLDGLLAHFARMIDQQLAFGRSPPPSSYRHTPRAPRTLTPHPLLGDPERSPVVGYLESVATPERLGEKLVQVCLERLTDGSRFERFVRPTTQLPAYRHLANMGLTWEQLDAGAGEDALAAEIRAFIRDSDILVAWSPTTIRLLQSLAAWRDVLSLKGAYANFTRTTPGELQALPGKHGVAVGDAHFSGRAGIRTAAAVAMTQWMRNRESTASPCART